MPASSDPGDIKPFEKVDSAAIFILVAKVFSSIGVLID